jgi:hypothetical protein
MKIADFFLMGLVPGLFKKTKTTVNEFSKSGNSNLFFMKLGSLACCSCSFVILISREHLLQTKFSYVIKIGTSLNLASVVFELFSKKSDNINEPRNLRNKGNKQE